MKRKAKAGERQPGRLEEVAMAWAGEWAVDNSLINAIIYLLKSQVFAIEKMRFLCKILKKAGKCSSFLGGGSW